MSHESHVTAMGDSLTPLERRVYHYLLDFLAENTYQPSVREIGRRFSIKSTKTVADILQSLALKGYVQRQDGRSRGLRILGFSSMGRTQPVPLFSRLDPLDAGQGGNRERFVALDRLLVPSDEAFLLRIADATLASRGIQAGDVVLVDPAARAREGEAVVARVGGDIVVRLLSRRGAELALGAPGAPDLLLGPADDFAIIGMVAGVLRLRAEALETTARDSEMD